MTTRQWGYERADCSGDYALNLFLDDMEHLVDHYAAPSGEQLETRLFQAQAAANKLLQAYEKNARNTAAFTGQFIEIKSVVDAQDVLQFVPIFSSGLKQQLIKLLKRSNTATQH
ncbi:hypothetical protein RE432_16260 [Pusillimonas sp. SM2304]|uniref:hypothetical protein n=1 Tax=Pusillimonas sp. SM2304 TaxID=3073241 RepID=UPI002876663D|nr:hypothetical protein [Pusillimonas sp. SM2304]MDS1141997.1 hypothetical protein [Pusillimonas sp. SM2304]